MWTLLTSFPMCVTRQSQEGSTRVQKNRTVIRYFRWSHGSGTVVPYFGDSRTRPWVCLSAGALCLLYVLSFYNCPGSLISMPLVSSQVPSFVPQEKKSARCCRFESLSDSGFIAPNMAFYRPYKAQTDISLATKRVK